MAGSENVFNIVQLGRQAGDFYAPGSAVPATFIYPVSEPVNFELDRGSVYPQQDRGENVRNHAGTGYHGVRGATGSLPSEVRFEDFMDILEMIYAGDVAPADLGGGLYGWTYPFEKGAPSVIPYTIETGNIDIAEAEHEVRSALVNELTFGFDDLSSPGASPWTMTADILAFDRVIAAVTGSLAPRSGLQTVQGHLTRIFIGSTATAFGSLSELTASLVGYQHTAQRNLTTRAYGSTSDVPSAFGFSELANATADAKIRVSTTAKTDLHDAWNSSGASLGEKRIRVEAAGSGGRIFRIDGRVGITAFPYDERDGERVYNAHFEFVRDDDLEASHQLYLVNGIAALEAGS
jgi:hypothetical protein